MAIPVNQNNSRYQAIRRVEALWNVGACDNIPYFGESATEL
jgi:hypothetical protein